MKIILLLVCFICTHAYSFELKQGITISEKNAHLVDIFERIKNQAGYLFLYNDQDIQQAKRVTINVKSATLNTVLEICFQDQALEYSIKGKTVIVRLKKSLAIVELVRLDSLPLKTTIKGRVVDESGKPLLASLTIKNSKLGTTTDENGEFEIHNVDITSSLIMSGVGIEAQEVAIRKRASLLIIGKVIVQPLEETVIKGYYNTLKKFNTGSVATVKGVDIQRAPIGDPIAALQGRVSGLYISQTSGVSGAGLTVMLRGQNSIANGNEPLYIVDGVPYPSKNFTGTIGSGATPAGLSPFASLNAAEIESIEVLKDADATSIYGSRGANGVILITTKRGRAGKTSLNLNVYSGVGEVANKLDLLNTKQYLDMRYEALRNDGVSDPPSWAHDINGNWDTTMFTDWQDIFIGKRSTQTNLQGSISGGSNNTNFMIGGGFRGESTIFPGEFSDSKAFGSANINHRSNDQKFTVNLSMRYMTGVNNLPTTNLTSQILLPPNAPAIYSNDGKLNWANDTWENPLAYTFQTFRAETENLIANMSISYQITPGLEVKSSFGYNNLSLDQTAKVPLSSFSPSYSSFSSIRTLSLADDINKTWIIEPQISFSRLLGGNSLSALIAATFQESENSSLSQTGYDFPSDEQITNIAAAASLMILRNTQSQYRYNAVFGRLNYNLLNKLILNVTGRRDGSSRFGPGKQFGNFYSIGAAWILSEEPFMKKFHSFCNFAKIRTSYGSSGNDRLPDYQYVSAYTAYSSPYFGVTGLYPTRLTNPYYSWETVKKMELGLELSFFKSKININTTYYRNRTDDQLVGYSLPATTGFTTIQANLPAKVSNTGVELEVSTTNITSKNFKWSSSLNLSVPRNKLISFPDLEKSSYNNTYVVGKSLFIAKTFKLIGVNNQTGIYEFEDLNKDGKISAPDDLQASKELSQRIFGGLQNSFIYKGLDLNFLFQFVKQAGFSYPTGFGFPGAAINQPTIILKRWKTPGDVTQIQKFTQTFIPAGEAYLNALNSDMKLGNASFIRLKNISLSCDFSKFLSLNVMPREFKIYAQCQNLFTITSFDGLDPEVNGITLPPLRILTVGIQIGL